MVASSASRLAMPAEEWRVRVDLAAMYRLVALQGWDDIIFTHISARVPGPEGHFLINPFHLGFDEITASDLLKVDLEGNLVEDGASGELNAAGYVIHSAIHAARADAHFVIHLHTLDAMAVAAQREGLMPIGQAALTMIPQLAYHEYEGIALDLAERERLVADLGNKRVMLLKKHGSLAVGASAGEAWFGIYMLERACAVQIRALSAGRDGVCDAPDAAQEQVAGLVAAGGGQSVYDAAWAALVRRVERRSPGFAC